MLLFVGSLESFYYIVTFVARAAAIARANEAKKKPTTPQQSLMSGIGRDLDRYSSRADI